jgi:hypothetical protein
VDKILEDGDGTVPRASAIPIELSDEFRDTFIPERHASLQCNEVVLADLLERLLQIQVKGLGVIKGPEIKPSAAERVAISVDLDDLYLEGEPVKMFVHLANAEKQDAYGPVQAQIQGIGKETRVITTNFQEDEKGWKLKLEGLLPGVYRIKVSTIKGGPGAPPALHDVFEIAG